jgi:hypothetical protein
MPNKTFKLTAFTVAAALAGLLLVLPAAARAHCDTLGGPVVKEGRTALESGNITPVLKWVKPDRETELRAAFDKARSVRALGPDARGLADLYFLETLVRLHRAGEGAPYTGLKDEPLDPIIDLSDKALAGGSAQALVQAISGHMASVLGERFRAALEAMKIKDASVEAGREFVEAYVIFTHYVEAVHAAIAASAAEHHH